QWPVLSVAADCAGHGLPADRIQPGRALEGMGILLALHPGIFRNTAAGDSTRWAGRGCDCLRRGACRRAAQSLGFQYRAVLATAADCAWNLDAGAAWMARRAPTRTGRGGTRQRLGGGRARGVGRIPAAGDRAELQWREPD